MRFSLVKLAKAATEEAWRAQWAKAAKEGAPMAIICKPSYTALAQKYAYSVRIDTYLDDVHGYAWWIMKNRWQEMWPLIGCMGFWVVFAAISAWWAIQKTEVQLNRFSEHRPWDWERAQHVFEKRHKLFFDDSYMWGRIPELDKLQAEMLEVKQQRLAAAKAAKKAAKEHH